LAEIFRDADFAALYAPKLGRPSVPPSLLATALVLQAHDKVSDDEATQRAAYDLRWKVALGVELDARPFAKSTLQEFRAQLVVHDDQRAIFQKSLELAKRQGYFPRTRKLTVALDTTNILGQGAIKDTYNLLADGIVVVLRVLATQAGEVLADWAERAGWGGYVTAPSLKGQAEIDWSDATARRRFLQAIVADADRLLEQVRTIRQQLAPDSADDRELADAAGLLARVLAQDIERHEDGPTLRDGVAADRMPSVHDPEMRHGRKSASKRFDGHKVDLAVDTDSQLITAVGVLAGNAADAEQALAMVEATEANTGCVVKTTIGDCAYGDGGTRKTFADAGRTLVAKVPTLTNQGCFPKTDFVLDLEAGRCTCPAGATTADYRPRTAGGGIFHFAVAVCGNCPLRAQCVRTGDHGRRVTVHPQERLLQEARALQAGPEFREYRTRRQVVEHRIARLVQLGIRQARYRGRAKTLFQVAMAAAVANFTVVMHRADPEASAVLLLAAAMVLGAVLVALRSNRTDFWGLPRPFVITTPEVPVPALARLSDFPGSSHKRLLRPNF
jgi:transposase